MMYSEFIEGTGCKQNAHNFKVYQDLEIMYMNSDLSKAEIYEYGKKLVDNSKSEKEIEFENGIYEEIENHKRQIEQYKERLKTDEDLLNRWKEFGDKEMITMYKRSVHYYKQEIKNHRNRIGQLKWILE